MNEWINCRDRLPDEDDIVIGSGFLYGKPENGRWVEPTILAEGEFHGLITDEDGEVVADFDGTMEPTHWMPLPPPPAD